MIGTTTFIGLLVNIYGAALTQGEDIWYAHVSFVDLSRNYAKLERLLFILKI